MLEKDSLSAWLDLVCKMMGRTEKAVLLLDAGREGCDALPWPTGESASEACISLAHHACLQNRLIVKKLDPNELDYILATPLNVASERKLAVAVQIRIQPEQQQTVLHLLKWGERWLELLVRNEIDDDCPSEPQSWASNWLAKIRLPAVAPIRLASAGMVLGVLALSFIEGTYRVKAQATLEGSVQRAVVAPFDGYVKAAPKRAGETVAAGEILVSMDDHELQLSRLQFESEKDEYTRQYRQALGQREMAQAFIYKSQVSQAEAELNLVQRKLEQSEIRAAMDGYIIAGDLSRSLGTPVELGDVLFEVAPLNSYRLVVYVQEQDIADVKPGAVGGVKLQALPGTKLGFVVTKVSPVFEDRPSSLVYRVEGKLDELPDALRPGMQGIARIEAGEHSLGWIYFHELYNAVALWLWKWLP
ncbi:MAG: HlyD family efflux transporter periplasmic adaptor subunit [Pseudomonas sp.]|nr:HlyD family efflux transporter periplasmic adaptor subunit [Pseudomonas sp.]